MLVLTAVVAFAVDSQIAFAQRINFGGNQGNRDRDEDDEDEDRDDDGESRSSRSQNRNSQIDQFLQRRQGTTGGQRRLEQFQNQQLQQQQQVLGRPQEATPSNLRIGTWQGDRWQGSRDIDEWTQAFRGSQQPFSQQWYQAHPKAWRDERHQDNVWVVATLPGVYSWLGWGNVPQQGGIVIGNAPPVDLSRFHDFYPLGVYSLMAGPGDGGTRIVQLAIDRHGHIAGNYYDMITDSNYSVSGDIRRQSQRVYWSLNKNKNVRFRAQISRLLRPYGTIDVQLPGGIQQWQFVRLEN
jgi:hypothetical protein